MEERGGLNSCGVPFVLGCRCRGALRIVDSRLACLYVFPTSDGAKKYSGEGGGEKVRTEAFQLLGARTNVLNRAGN